MVPFISWLELSIFPLSIPVKQGQVLFDISNILLEFHRCSMIFTVFSKIHVYKNHSAIACWNCIILNRAGTLTGSPHAFEVIIFWLHPKVRSKYI